MIANESVLGHRPQGGVIPSTVLKWNRSSPCVWLSNKPLQRTKACQLSVDGQRAGAARLIRDSAGAARPRQCYYRPSRNGPCS